MKDKKFLILLSFALIVAFLFFYTSGAIEKYAQPHHSVIPKEPTAVQLEMQVAQLRGVITAFVQIGRSLDKAHQTQRLRAEDLDKKLREAISQVQGLNKELTQAKVSLELTQPIRQSFKDIQSSLSGLELKRGKEKEILAKIKEIEKTLNSIDRQLSGLFKENKSYRSEAKSLTQALDKKEKESAILKQQRGEEQSKKQTLAKDSNVLSQQLKMLNQIKSFVEQRNSSLEEA